MDQNQLRKEMVALGFSDIIDRDRMDFTVDAILGRPHSVRIRVERHPQGWWQCTFTDGWETTFLDSKLLNGFDAVRRFVAAQEPTP